MVFFAEEDPEILKKSLKRGMGPTCQKYQTSQQRLTANLAYPSVCGTRRRRHTGRTVAPLAHP